jgi:hypothetical protein
MMQKIADPLKDANGSVMMTQDILDLSVIHLSSYERLQRRYFFPNEYELSWVRTQGKDRLSQERV